MLSTPETKGDLIRDVEREAEGVGAAAVIEPELVTCKEIEVVSLFISPTGDVHESKKRWTSSIALSLGKTPRASTLHFATHFFQLINDTLKNKKFLL